MKKIAAIITLALIVLASLPLGAAPRASEIGLWALDFYSTGTEAQTEIDKRVKTDFLPVALEVNQDQGIAVFFVKNFSKIRLKTRIDQVPLPQLGATLKELLLKDWLPQDVCFRGNTSYVLSLEDPGASFVTGAVVESLKDIKTIQADLNKWAKDGYVPMGISVDNNVVYTLVLKDPRNPFKEIKLSKHLNDGQSAFVEIDRMVDANWRLMGFATTDKDVFVLYIK